MRARSPAGTTAVQLAAALLFSVAISLLTTDSIGQSSDAQFTGGGPAACTRCHGSESMTIVAETAHGNTDNPFTPYSNEGCESCHGPGSLHVSRARGGIGFPAMLAFKPGESPQRQTGACLNCHANDMGELEGMEWQGSIHATAGISCINCHQEHMVGNPLVERDAQVEKCATCHSAQIENHRRFENVGIVFDELKCFNCHDVHQMIREP